MDLAIPVEDTTLYIRVAGIIQTPKGYLFEKSDKGYIFTVGGKIKINETSEEAMKREVWEEVGMEFIDFNLCAVMENLFSKGNSKVHEICFIYEIKDIFNGTVPENFVEVTVEQIDAYDVRPKPIYDLIKSDRKSVRQVIQK
jgi:8-oxo-dGTP pyrophosphatase MutT (NUDIX family)